MTNDILNYDDEISVNNKIFEETKEIKEHLNLNPTLNISQD
jgi:hypothetical protein